MALRKELEHASGAKAEYWIVGELTVSFLQPAAKIVMLGFVNADARRSGKPPLDSREIQVQGEDALKLRVDSPKAIAYGFARKVGDGATFGDAEDA